MKILVPKSAPRHYEEYTKFQGIGVFVAAALEEATSEEDVIEDKVLYIYNTYCYLCKMSEARIDRFFAQIEFNKGICSSVMAGLKMIGACKHRKLFHQAYALLSRLTPDELKSYLYKQPEAAAVATQSAKLKKLDEAMGKLHDDFYHLNSTEESLLEHLEQAVGNLSIEYVPDKLYRKAIKDYLQDWNPKENKK